MIPIRKAQVGDQFTLIDVHIDHLYFCVYPLYISESVMPHQWHHFQSGNPKLLVLCRDELMDLGFAPFIDKIEEPFANACH